MSDPRLGATELCGQCEAFAVARPLEPGFCEHLGKSLPAHILGFSESTVSSNDDGLQRHLQLSTHRKFPRRLCGTPRLAISQRDVKSGALRHKISRHGSADFYVNLGSEHEKAGVERGCSAIPAAVPAPDHSRRELRTSLYASRTFPLRLIRQVFFLQSTIMPLTSPQAPCALRYLTAAATQALHRLSASAAK